MTHSNLETPLGQISVELTKAYEGATFERAGFYLRRVNDGSVAAVYLQRLDGAVDEASPSDIQVGDMAKIWTTFAEMRSDPPQYNATQIVIVRD